MPRHKKVDDASVLKMILDVIVQQGAMQFSLEDLSKKTTLSPATLLQRFGSKKNILHKALELANQDLKKDLMALDLANKSPLDEIINIYLELALPFAQPMDIANGLDILKLDISDKKLNDLTRKYFEIRRNKIESLICVAQERGELSSTITPDQIAWNLECLWQGSIMLWALIGKGGLPQWLKKRLLTYLES